MILLGLLIPLLQIICAHELSVDSILPNDNSEVIAVDINGDSIAIATTKNVNVYTYQSHLVNGDLIGSIPLNRSLTPLSGFLEFRLLSHQHLFFCDYESCSFCTISRKNWSCSSLNIVIDEPIHMLKSAAVARTTDKLLLRIVDVQERAAVISYEVQDSGQLNHVQIAKDAPFVMRQNFVLGFERKEFAFFVGSGVQPYEPAINARLDVAPKNVTIIKIMRICSLDKTKDIESRMELALSCGNNDEYTDVGAAHYDQTVDQLTIVMTGPQGNHTVCRFDMVVVHERFENDWNLCQTTTKLQRDECYNGKLINGQLSKHCYIFTRAPDYAMQTCMRFGRGEEIYQNCELDRLRRSSYRYGWIESYLPLIGTTVGRLYDKTISYIYSVAPDLKKGIFLAGNFEQKGKIIRILSSEESDFSGNSHPLWSQEISTGGPFSIAFYDHRNALYMADGKEVRIVNSTCQGLYNSCDQLYQGKFMDPLRCVWCPDEEHKLAISVHDANACKQPLSEVCPPRISQANRESNASEWQINGYNLRRMQNPVVYVCDEKCNVKTADDSSLQCFMEEVTEATSDCKDVVVKGQLGQHKDFMVEPEKVTFSAPSQTEAEPSTKSKSSSKIWKAIVAVVAILLILLAIGILVWWARKRNLKKKDDHGSQIAIDIIGNGNRSRPIDNNYVASYSFDNISLYQQIFNDIDDRLKIDYRSLRFETQLGNGYFGVVNRASHTEANGEVRKVACKMIREGSNGVTDFIKEGLVMDNFHHPRVMGLIGIAFTDSKTPIIVTEYMPNGDLVTYLREATNQPTLRNLLMFAVQIAEGMEYMHSLNFVHRDLAARNCMLDDEMNIKIIDFGLCREVNDDLIYMPTRHRSLPTRWMPIEALEGGQFTLQGDVWAYGVVLWELLTRGNMPYRDKKTSEDLLDFLKPGNRLRMPDYCPPQLYTGIMLPCWDNVPEERPSFTELKTAIMDLIRNMESTQISQLYSHYEKVTPSAGGTFNSNSGPAVHSNSGSVTPSTRLQ